MDSGELVAAAYTLGVDHALFLILARLSTLLPLGAASVLATAPPTRSSLLTQMPTSSPCGMSATWRQHSQPR